MDKKLELFNYRVAKTILGNRRINSDWVVAWHFAQGLLQIFPDSIEIKDEASLAAFYSKEYLKSAEIINDLLEMKPPRYMVARVMGNKRFCVPHLIEQARKVKNEDEIIRWPGLYSPYIFVCKNTSKRTINSFINHCTDWNLFSHFYYLYDSDQSSDIPPYFEMIKYDKSILNSLGSKCTPYIFNMVGDWMFFDKRNYVTIMRDILDSAGNDSSYGQVLLNSQSIDDWSNKGTEKYTELERRYFEDVAEFDGLAPSLINREILYEYEFEVNYKANHKTALMDGLHVVG